jgi:cytidylate kinase
MAVITISRGSFTGGKILAECLATRLGYRCIDRDVIVERAAAYGASQEELRDAMEKPPSFWDRFKHKKYVYLTLIQAALTEEVRGGKAVYHGHAGHLLLRGVSHVLRARIIAPMEFRLATIQDRLKLDRAEAMAYTVRMDQDRAKWTQYLYGVNWGDPTLYDVVLNLEYMDIQEACETITTMANLKCFTETPESLAAMEDLALASKVRANLVCNAATLDLELDVSARGGVVTIRGKLRNQGQFEQIREMAWKVPGVERLEMSDLVQVLDV